MIKSFLMLLFLSVFFISCNNCNTNFIYQPPANGSDGLTVGTLTSVNLDSAKITKAVNSINCGKYGEVHSLLIYKRNLLVLEEYFKGHRYKWDEPEYHGELVDWDRDMNHEMMSVTKSFTSACIGIAVDKGFIKSVNQSIFDYLPDHQHLKTNNKEYITIEHLITMTSGLVWDEWSVKHGSAANDIDMLWFDCEEPISCVLEKPWREEPGKLFTYNGGGMVILAEIIKNATKMNIFEFSKMHLFQPLGIENAEWIQFPGGAWDGAGSLYITPRDMLKIGATYLNDGLWEDERIISSSWIEKSSSPFRNNIDIKIPGEDSGKNGYGYTWWTSDLSHNGTEIKMFRAGGWGGQEIMVFPELEMVVVFTGGNYDRKTKLYKLLESSILPAIK